MRATDVFTPNRTPTLTYVDGHLVDRKQSLSEAIRTGGNVVSLSGPSKSGKTTFIESEVGKDNLVSVTGAGVQSAAQLWERVFAQIGTSIPQGESETRSREYEVGAEARTGGAVAILVGDAGASGSLTRATATTEQRAAPFDPLTLLVSEMAGTGLVVFVDDFHYIARDVQREIASQIKDAAWRGVHIVVASVPYHSDDAFRANPDLRGRLNKIDFAYWDKDELIEIGTTGFNKLNVEIDESYIERLAEEAAGSPQLMQSLCLHTCFALDIDQAFVATQSFPLPDDLLDKVCKRVAATTDCSTIAAKMIEGPKVRGQARTSYVLRGSGRAVDVYPLVVQAIARNPPELTIRYQNLVGRIQALCEGDQPSGSSVTGACSQIAKLANEAENRVVIEWDSESDVLDIRDPYLLFYLRWGRV